MEYTINKDIKELYIHALKYKAKMWLWFKNKSIFVDCSSKMGGMTCLPLYKHKKSK